MGEKPLGQRSVLGDSAKAEPAAYLTDLFSDVTLLPERHCGTVGKAYTVPQETLLKPRSGCRCSVKERNWSQAERCLA